MPRPKKWRKICCLPDNSSFGPLNSSQDSDDYVVMTIDEYEAIRLIDLVGFTQEECANQMNVARTTIQAMYNNARKKIAQSLVNGKILLIQGGEYRLCDGMGEACKGSECRRNRNRQALLADTI